MSVLLLPTLFAGALYLSPADIKIVSPIPSAGESAKIKPVVNYGVLSWNYTEAKEPKTNIEKYIKTIFGKDGDIAYAIARAESGLRPSAKLITKHETSIGIFQINIQSEQAKVHYHRIPGNTLNDKIAWLEVPENNVLMAYWIYSHSGFSPWSVYKNNSYQNYL